jgi:hypothetical protein
MIEKKQLNVKENFKHYETYKNLPSDLDKLPLVVIDRMNRELIEENESIVKYNDKPSKKVVYDIKGNEDVHANEYFDMDSMQGFTLIDTKRGKFRKSKIQFAHYSNKNNFISVSLFIAARNALKKYIDSDYYVGVTFKAVVQDESGSNDEHDYSFTHVHAMQLLKCETPSQIDNFMNSFNDKGQGSDRNYKIANFRTTKFTLFLKSKNLEGNGLCNTPVSKAKNLVHRKCGYITITPRTIDNNNCLIDCFKFFVKSKIPARKIRSHLCLPLEGPLNISHAPELEKYFGKKCAIVTGRMEGEPVFAYGDKDCDFGILHNEDHFSFIRAEDCKFISDEIKPKEDKNKISRFMFFDFETVYDKTGKLYPYSLSALLYDQNFKLVDEYFQTDIVGKKRSIIKDTFIDFLRKHDDFRYNTIMVAYNGARFDNFLLGEILAQSGFLDSHNFHMANGQMLKMRFASYTVIDLCRFVMQPLNVACRGFGVDQGKLDFSHIVPQKAQLNGTFGEWLKENESMIKDYNVRDNEILMKLFAKVRECIKTTTGEYIEEYMTISQIAYKKWRDQWPHASKTGSKMICPPPHQIHAPIIREAMIAGRSQAFKTGFFETEMNSLDVKSLYPFVMYECKFPIGQEMLTEVYMPEALGVYRVRIGMQPLTKIIPKRTPDQPLDWDYNGPIVCMLSSVDIECLKDYGACVQFLPLEEYQGTPYDKCIGMYWESSAYVFRDYVKIFKDGKTEQDDLKRNMDLKLNEEILLNNTYKENADNRYDPDLKGEYNSKLEGKYDPNMQGEYNAALREIYKLFLNTLSGKVGQREYMEDTEFCFNENSLTHFINSHSNVIIEKIPNIECIKVTGKNMKYTYKNHTAKPVHLAVFIYSYARSHMYRSILSKTENKFFTDTDSCHMPESEIAKLIQDPKGGFGKFRIGSEFGDFEREIDFKTQRYYSVGPKCYAIYGEKKCKLRFKGINSRSDKLYRSHPSEVKLRKEFSSTYMSEGEKKKYVLRPFEKLLRKQKLEYNMENMFNLYQELPIACSEKLYHTLCVEKKAVCILSSQIKRTTGEGYVSGLRQNYVIKTINVRGEVHR